MQLPIGVILLAGAATIGWTLALLLAIAGPEHAAPGHWVRP